MERFGWGRITALLSVVAFVLAGCGGQTIQSFGAALPSVAKQSQVIRHGKAWMLRRATSVDLIYATGGCGGTCVISYPLGQLVGGLPVGSGNASGDCVDGEGNVYISNGTSVVEYAHGGTTPINTFNIPGTNALGCGVDPTTGNLAVAFVSVGANIAIFPPGGGTPATYGAAISVSTCGYDDQGNLFAGGYNGQDYGLSELPVGSSTFFVLQINGKVGRPGQVQFDGKYVAYQGTTRGQTTVTQLSISGSTATAVHQIQLKGIKGRSYFSWISSSVILVPFQQHGDFAKQIGVWSYPAGGKRTAVYKNIVQPHPNFHAVTLSLATSH